MPPWYRVLIYHQRLFYASLVQGLKGRIPPNLALSAFVIVVKLLCFITVVWVLEKITDFLPCLVT